MQGGAHHVRRRHAGVPVKLKLFSSIIWTVSGVIARGPISTMNSMPAQKAASRAALR